MNAIKDSSPFVGITGTGLDHRWGPGIPDRRNDQNSDAAVHQRIAFQIKFPGHDIAEAAMPNISGVYRRRCLARNANIPSARIKKAIVNGSKYVAEIRNPSPTEDRIASVRGPT
ncbi:MAG TPA: hypothetical protein VJ731_11470 [Terriglobales bacterium]|nr:hypothetical protein [Terriglobales bacterium]